MKERDRIGAATRERKSSGVAVRAVFEDWWTAMQIKLQTAMRDYLVAQAEARR
jgi:hypothetical protein